MLLPLVVPLLDSLWGACVRTSEAVVVNVYVHVVVIHVHVHVHEQVGSLGYVACSTESQLVRI